jgi:hypothetical protein
VIDRWIINAMVLTIECIEFDYAMAWKIVKPLILSSLPFKAVASFAR